MEAPSICSVDTSFTLYRTHSTVARQAKPDTINVSRRYRSIYAILQIQLLEHSLRDAANDPHDGRPLKGNIERVHPLVDRGDDGLRDLIDISKLFRALHA